MTTFARLTLPFIEKLRTFPPCCRLLYEWLLERYPAGRPQEVFLEDFAERLKYNVRHVRRSLKQLMDHHLVESVHRYSADVFKLIVHDDRTLNLLGDPGAASQSSALAENSAEPARKDPVSSTKKSTSSPSNPHSSVTNNKEKIRDYKDTHPLHPVLNEPKNRLAASKDPTVGTNDCSSSSSLLPTDVSILEEIQATLQKPLNKNILAVMAEYPITRALDALDAFRETIARGNHIRNPLGWFRTALEKGYKPQAVSVSGGGEQFPEASSTTSHSPTSPLPKDFNEWFNFAKQVGVALASGERNGELYIYGNNLAEPYEQMRQTWPLAKLRELVNLPPVSIGLVPVSEPTVPQPSSESLEDDEQRQNALARLQVKWKWGLPLFREQAIVEAKLWGFEVKDSGIFEGVV